MEVFGYSLAIRERVARGLYYSLPLFWQDQYLMLPLELSSQSCGPTWTPPSAGTLMKLFLED